MTFKEDAVHSALYRSLNKRLLIINEYALFSRAT
jgi:hypothetical protein